MNIKRKEDMMTLNVELRTNEGFEPQNEDMALNDKRKTNNDSEC